MPWMPPSLLRFRKTLIFLLLVVLAGFITWQRWHTYTEPLDNDVSLYAVNGHELLHGQVMYRDIWEIKPPGTIYSFALAELLVGYGQQQIFALAVLASCLTMLGLYRAGQTAYGTAAGLVAAACWTIINADMTLEANKPNVEVFLNTTLVWLFVGFLRLPPRPRGWQLLGLGALAALASLYKQFVVVEAVFLLAAHLVWPGKSAGGETNGSSKRLPAVVQVLLFGAAFTLVWFALLLQLSLAGGLSGFISILTVVGKTYAGNPLQNLVTGLQKAPPLPPYTRHLWPLVLVALPTLVVGFLRGNRRHWGLLLAFVVATHLSVSMPGRFFNHYYQLWFPVLCICAGWSVGFLRQEFAASGKRFLAPAAAAAVFGLLLSKQIPDFMLPPQEWSLHKYGRIYLETQKLGTEIKENLPGDEVLFEWGMESGIYFYSGHRRASGLDWSSLTPFNTIINQNPFYSVWTNRFREDWDKTKPAILIVNDRLGGGENYDWLMQRYRPFPGDNRRGRFLLYVRKGSGLEKQMYPGVP